MKTETETKTEIEVLQIYYKGVFLDVKGTFYPGSDATYEDAPEPDKFEIEKVSLEYFDVSELLEDDYPKIEKDIIEKFYN